MNPKDIVGQTKPNLSIIPFAPLLEVCGALTEGAIKYGPWNWRDEHVSETIYADAAIRHLMQFLAGEDVDPDSGIHHVSKAIAGLVILRDAQIHGCSEDNRGHKQDLNIAGVMEQIASVREKYSHTDANIDPTTPVKTVAGGGSYEITSDDVGKRVVMRDGSGATITEFRDDSKWPVYFEVDAECEFEDDSCTAGGRSTCSIERPNDLPYDVVAVCQPSVDVATCDQIRKDIVVNHDPFNRPSVTYSVTVAGGGSYEIKKTDVGKRVLLRDGSESVIGDVLSVSTWPVEYIHDEQGQSFDSTCTTGGYFSHWLPETVVEDSWDIVKVYH